MFFPKKSHSIIINMFFPKKVIIFWCRSLHRDMTPQLEHIPSVPKNEQSFAKPIYYWTRNKYPFSLVQLAPNP
jgi:hypothetical protein